MNKRDAINHIRQFGGRLDRFRKSVGGSGDGGRNAPKRAKSSPKPVNRKTNVFNEQVRYAFHGSLQDLKSCDTIWSSNTFRPFCAHGADYTHRF